MTVLGHATPGLSAAAGVLLASTLLLVAPMASLARPGWLSRGATVDAPAESGAIRTPARGGTARAVQTCGATVRASPPAQVAASCRWQRDQQRRGDLELGVQDWPVSRDLQLGLGPMWPCRWMIAPIRLDQMMASAAAPGWSGAGQPSLHSLGRLPLGGSGQTQCCHSGTLAPLATTVWHPARTGCPRLFRPRQREESRQPCCWIGIGMRPCRTCAMAMAVGGCASASMATAFWWTIRRRCGCRVPDSGSTVQMELLNAQGEPLQPVFNNRLIRPSPTAVNTAWMKAHLSDGNSTAEREPTQPLPAQRHPMPAPDAELDAAAVPIRPCRNKRMFQKTKLSKTKPFRQTSPCRPKRQPAKGHHPATLDACRRTCCRRQVVPDGATKKCGLELVTKSGWGWG